MHHFYKPDEDFSDDEDDIVLDVPEEELNDAYTQLANNPYLAALNDDDDDFEVDTIGSDDSSDEEYVPQFVLSPTPIAGSSSSSSREVIRSPDHRRSTRDTGDDTEIEDEDDVVRAIIAATKSPRSHPPDIITEDFVVDLSFHPEEDILAVGTLTGDVLVYKYGNDENVLMNTLEVHTKAIRDIEFNLDGTTLFSTSKDKAIMLSDVHTGKLKRFYDNAHESPVYSMNVFSENLFATGDEDGTLKLWDLRDKDSTPIFSLKEVDDYISAILTNNAQKMLVITSGDGYLTAVNIGARKLYVQSEPYEEELTCMGLFRNDSKLVVGSSKGRFYTFNWDEFGLHSNMFPGPKSPMSLMVPVTERIAIVGGEEGILRAMHVVPGRNLGVVGQHSLGVEAMDICNSGEFVASSSHDNDIKFWNIKYFEDFDDIKYNEKHNKQKEQRHNLPSSKQSNAGAFFADLV